MMLGIAMALAGRLVMGALMRLLLDHRRSVYYNTNNLIKNTSPYISVGGSSIVTRDVKNRYLSYLTDSSLLIVPRTWLVPRQSK